MCIPVRLRFTCMAADMWRLAGREALREIGINSDAEVTRRLQDLGRSGALPWLHEDLQPHLSYIDNVNFILVPVAHCLLHGLTKDLMVYALATPLSDVPADHPVVFNSKQRKAVQVCICATSAPLY